LEKKIGKVPKFFKELTEKDPAMYELVMKFEEHIWDEGALSRKDKEVNRHCDCSRTPRSARGPCPVGRSGNLGVTKDEVEEALRVTFLLSGMPAYVYGKAQLDEVMK